MKWLPTGMLLFALAWFLGLIATAHANSVIITVCDDPVYFIYGDGETVYLIPGRDEKAIAEFAERILKDIEQGNAIQYRADPPTVACGTLF